MANIVLNDLDIEKDAKFASFLEGDEYTPEDKFLIRPTRQFTDAEYEGLFMKIATIKPAESFDDYKKMIHNVFDGKLDVQLGRWEEKLALDRTRLNEIFGPKE